MPSTATIIQPTVQCDTCFGSGLVWRSSTKGNAAFRCPDCPDDGTGNCCGTGRRLLPTVFT